MCTHDPRSYVVECYLPLVWSPKANWSCLRGQTKSDSQDEGLLGSHPGVNRWLGVKFGRKGAIHSSDLVRRIDFVIVFVIRPSACCSLCWTLR